MHVGGIIGILRFGPFAGVIRHLGYPDYLMTILGVSYALAGLALLATGVPRLTNGPTPAWSSTTRAQPLHTWQCLGGP